MYSLDINFLKDRTERPADVGVVQTRGAQESQRPLYIGVAVAAFLIATALGLRWFLQSRNAELEQQLVDLNTRLATVQALEQEITTINTQVEALKSDSRALATVFDQIKPWSAVLQDVRDRVPAGVQISRIEQTQPETPPVATPPPPTDPNAPPVAAAPPPPPPTSTIAISGRARSFSDVNDFLLTLQRSPFLKSGDTRLVTANLVDNPTAIEFSEENSTQIEVRLPQVVDYTIQGSLTDLPASALLQDLERNLAVGLAARIQALRDRGVLTP
jgi:type IV pilus assembly protein PilN